METDHKQKVLVVHNYYQIPGGEDTVVDNEKKLLEEHGHKVVLYTRHNNELKNMSIIKKMGLPFTTVFNLKTYRDIKKIITEQDIQIVHIHNTLSLISPAVYYAAIRCGVPVIQTVHNFRFLCPGATFYRNGNICEECVSKGLGCAIRHKCYRGSRAQTIICVINTWFHRHTGILSKINYICLTKFNKEKLLKLKYIRAEKVYIKPNFTFGFNEAAMQEAKRNYYLYVGRLEEIKGVRLLIDAFFKMPNRVLKLAGQGPLKEELESKAGPNVMFLGQVPHEALMKLIADARAVILPSQIYEGFPMIIPEAFSMSTPMIVGDIGNNGTLILDGNNGMKFKHYQVEDLLKTIDRFEACEYKKIQASAYTTYQTQYSAEANYAKLQQIYNEVH